MLKQTFLQMYLPDTLIVNMKFTVVFIHILY